MPVITSIVAKLMLLVDAFLENFVTVSTAAVPAAQSNCLVNYVYGGLTPCGQAAIDEYFQWLAVDLLGLGSDLAPWLPMLFVNT